MNNLFLVDGHVHLAL